MLEVRRVFRSSRETFTAAFFEVKGLDNMTETSQNNQVPPPETPQEEVGLCLILFLFPRKKKLKGFCAGSRDLAAYQKSGTTSERFENDSVDRM